MAALDSYCERKAAVLGQRQADFRANPEKAVLTLTASSRVAGITGVRPTQMGSHMMISDSAPGLAGHALGPTAPEILLGALASCLVHTYVIQAVLLNIPVDHIQVDVEGNLDMTGVVGLDCQELPAIQDITYHAIIESPAPDEDIARMHEIVGQTCPVLNTLRYPVSVERKTNTPQPK